jgi:hypothetical protein
LRHAKVGAEGPESRAAAAPGPVSDDSTALRLRPLGAAGATVVPGRIGLLVETGGLVTVGLTLTIGPSIFRPGATDSRSRGRPDRDSKD